MGVRLISLSVREYSTEICASKGAKWMRLSGNAVVCTTTESQAKALEVMPMLSGMYSIGDGSFEIIAIENGIADFNTMTRKHHQVTL